MAHEELAYTVQAMSRESPLGKPTSYPEQYSPELLYSIDRGDGRAALGLSKELPFHGVDIWNAWELSWLDAGGKPHVAAAEVRVPAASRSIVESKSLKLYLNSFSMTRFDSTSEVAAIIGRDISACVGSDVAVRVRSPSKTDALPVARLPGACIDALDVHCHAYHVESDLLAADKNEIVREDLHTHLLRTLCPVTSQPDTGSLLFSYRGPRIDREGLLRYVVSYRQHNDFHEACVERMFVDILERCGAEQLTVYARYLRRGGIDINPFRSNFEEDPPDIRLWRQ